MKRVLLLSFVIVVVSLGLGIQARATTLDPQIYFCQTGPCTSAPGGTAAGGESNLITSSGSFDLGFNQGAEGANPMQSPLLIIVGVYNGMGTPSVSFGAVSSEPKATVGTYGLTANTGTLTTGEDAYTQLGIPEGAVGVDSESFGNWSGADVANGFTAPTTFSLYAFAVPTSLSSKNAIAIDEDGAAKGSFILAYDCAAPDTTFATCSGGDVGSTPFTNAGLLDSAPVPEPSSLLLLGSGLFGIAGLMRRKLFS